LRVLGNIGAVADEEVRMNSFVANDAYVNAILGCISQKKQMTVVKESLWSLSTIFSTLEVLKVLNSHGVVDRILDVAADQPTSSTLTECMHIIRRVCQILLHSGDANGFVQFVTSRDFSILVWTKDMLLGQSSEAIELGLDMCDLIMGRIPNSKGVYLMEERQVIDAIELAREFNDRTYDRAEYLMDKYFGESYGM
jgi:hypothetical protein